MALLEKVALDYLLALLTDGRAEKVPLPIREIAFAKLRGDEKKLAQQVEEARAAREAAEARATSARRRQAAARRGRPQASPRPPATRPRPPPAGASGAQLAGYAISRYPDVADVVPAAERARRASRSVRSGATPWTATSTTSRRSAAAARSSPTQRDGAHPRRRAAQPRLQLPVPAGHREGRGRPPLGRRRQRVHRLPAGRRPDRARQQLRAAARARSPRWSSSPARSPACSTSTSSSWRELVNRLMPACEMFRMLGSGTESVMAAIRGARAFTGKKWVIKIGGAYHGWSDQMVYGLHVPGTWRFEAKGIPFGATARTREVFPNDLDALRRKLQAEPAAGRHGGRDRRADRAGERHPAGAVRLQRRRARAVRRVRRAAHLRRGRHRLPARAGRGAGLLRRAPRPHRLRQVHHRRLPDGRRRRRPPRRDGELRLRHRRQERRARLRRRHAERQPAELRRRLLRHHRDGAHQRAGARRAGRRPAHRRPQRIIDEVRPAVRRLQPGLDRPPRDLGRDAPRPQAPAALRRRR